MDFRDAVEDMNATAKDDVSMVFSYLQLRKSIGLLGCALPFVLALGAIAFFQTGLQSSISSYYHTGMQDVFVGILCVIGLFLLSYKGYERKDAVAGNIASICAVGTALFPTATDEAVWGATAQFPRIHLVFATLFF